MHPIAHPTAHPTLEARSHARLRSLTLCHSLIGDQAGSGALEHIMVLALVLLGATTIADGAASFLALAAQHLGAMLTAWLPA